MPIPLARRNAKLQLPNAQAGKVYDPSDSIANIGNMAANSYKLAAEAATDMGKAIEFIERQNESLAIKEASLKKDEAFSAALTKLQQHQGLDAEEYRNTEFRKDIEKAQLEFNNVAGRLKHSDIANQYVAGSIEDLTSLNAKADNYAYDQKVNASNAMSKSILENYKRKAQEIAPQLHSLNPEMRQLAQDTINKNLALSMQEVQDNAIMNGLTDPAYLELKRQETADLFHIDMAEHISSLPDGIRLAQEYLDANKGTMTTAAWTKANANLAEDRLVDEIMKDPNSFIKNGDYDMNKARAVTGYKSAKDPGFLNDRERRRILNAALGSTISQARKGGMAPTGAEIKALAAIGVKDKMTINNSLAQMGLVLDAKFMMPGADNEARNAFVKEMSKNGKSYTVGDTYNKFKMLEKLAGSKVVYDRNSGQEIPLPENEFDAQLVLSQYERDPNSFIVQDRFALAGYSLPEIQAAYEEYLNNIKGWENEPTRGFFWGREEYSTYDVIAKNLRETLGFTPSQVVNIYREMEAHLRDRKRDANGNLTKEFEYPNLINFDFSEKGAYDEMMRTNSSALGEIDRLVTAAMGSGANREANKQFIDLATQNPATAGISSYNSISQWAMERGSMDRRLSERGRFVEEILPSAFGKI